VPQNVYGPISNVHHKTNRPFMFRNREFLDRLNRTISSDYLLVPVSTVCSSSWFCFLVSEDSPWSRHITNSFSYDGNHVYSFSGSKGDCAVAHSVSGRRLTAVSRVHSNVGTGFFFPSTSVYPCQYRPTSISYSLTY